MVAACNMPLLPLLTRCVHCRSGTLAATLPLPLALTTSRRPPPPLSHIPAASARLPPQPLPPSPTRPPETPTPPLPHPATAVTCHMSPGWEFEGGSGECVRIPQLAEGASVPRASRLRVYPLEEREGIAWVWMGERCAHITHSLC
jgi:hypothetical protein